MPAIPPNINLEGFKKSMCDGIDGAFNKGVKHGRYLALQERFSQKEAAQPKWISVEDRLPTTLDEVLICLYRKVTIAWYCGNGGFEIGSGAIFWAGDGTVTHWMPMPQAPEVKT